MEDLFAHNLNNNICILFAQINIIMYICFNESR